MPPQNIRKVQQSGMRVACLIPSRTEALPNGAQLGVCCLKELHVGAVVLLEAFPVGILGALIVRVFAHSGWLKPVLEEQV